jgi:hypothetical protein
MARDRGGAGAIDLRDRRFQRDAARLHKLGPRALYELLSELGATRLLRTQIEALVARYAGIDPMALAVTGGDRTQPTTLHAVSVS